MWLLEKTVGHKHLCQIDMEALASVQPQTCLYHVSYLPGPREQVASLSHIASLGSNQSNWCLVRTSLLIPMTKGNTISLGWPRLQRFTRCPARHPKPLEPLPATHCTGKPHCYLVRSLPNCQRQKPAEPWWAPNRNCPANWCQYFRKHGMTLWEVCWQAGASWPLLH